MNAARIAEARSRIDLVDLIGRTVKLSRGRRYRHGPCPFCQDGPKSTAFWVDPRAQKFGCFKVDEHRGDVFDWLRQTQGLSLAEACDMILGRAGLDRLAAAVAPAPRRPDPAPEERREAEIRRNGALSLWSAALPAAGTLVETYLRARGVTAAIPASLRYHPGLEYVPLRVMADDGRAILRRGPLFPAMIALVIDAERRPRGVHRTYLRHDGLAKAEVDAPKRMLGDVRGGYVPLSPSAPDQFMAEGIESALSVLSDVGGAVAACLSLNNWDAATPPIVERLTLCVDMDEAYRTMSSAERRARLRAGKRLSDPEDVIRAAVMAHAARGVTVKVARPPLGMDFNDMLRAAQAGALAPARLPPVTGPGEIARRYESAGTAA